MELLVPIRQVIRVTGMPDIEDGTLPAEARSYALNEWDRYAIAAAVDAAAGVSTSVTLVAVGPERAETALETGLAMGADEALRVWTPQLATTTPDVDVRPTVSVLAAVVRNRQPELVLTGAQSSDAARAATGVALAERCGYAWASRAVGIDIDPDEGTVRVRRELEERVEARLTVELPAVLTVQTGIVSADPPADADEEGPVDVRAPGAFGLDAGALDPDRQTVTDLRVPPGLQAVDRSTTEAAAAAEAIVETLAARGVAEDD